MTLMFLTCVPAFLGTANFGKAVGSPTNSRAICTASGENSLIHIEGVRQGTSDSGA